LVTAGYGGFVPSKGRNDHKFGILIIADNWFIGKLAMCFITKTSNRTKLSHRSIPPFWTAHSCGGWWYWFYQLLSFIHPHL